MTTVAIVAAVFGIVIVLAQRHDEEARRRDRLQRAAEQPLVEHRAHEIVERAREVARTPAPHPAQASAPRAPSGARDKRPHATTQARSIKDHGVVFAIGSRVRLGQRVGTLEPPESGHSRPVAFGPGQTGRIVDFERAHGTEVPVVRWDAQTWCEWDAPLRRMEIGKAYTVDEINRMNAECGPSVELRSLDQAVHAGYLELE